MILYGITFGVIIVHASWPHVVLVQEHASPDFALCVTEPRFIGTSHNVLRAAGGMWCRLPPARDEVGTVFAGNWFDTAPIDSRSLEMEWHDERHLVALRGSTHSAADADLYLMLLMWDNDGVVTEGPIHVSGEGARGDDWGRIIRERRHQAIAEILSAQ
jgi:hypothetical protein